MDNTVRNLDAPAPVRTLPARHHPYLPLRLLYLSILLIGVLANPICAERLPVRVYTTTDGLSSSAINYLLHDSRGFLWCATRDGLNRFDGKKFTSYRIGQASSPSVAQILERHNGDYLVILQSGAIYRFSAQIKAVSTNDGTAADQAQTLQAEPVGEADVSEIYEDRAGNLWGAGRGLFLFNESNHHLTAQSVELNLRRPGEPQFDITHIREGQDGSLWLITTLGLVRRANDGRTMLYREPKAVPLGVFLTSVLEDKAGRIWIGSRGGVYVLQPLPLSDPSAFLPHQLPTESSLTTVALPSRPGEIHEFSANQNGFPGGLIQYLYQTMDGRVWLTGNGRLLVFEGNEFRNFDATNGLATRLAMMTEDRDGNLWLASLDGLVKLIAHGPVTYGTEDGLGNGTIRSIYQTDAGNLYVVNGDWQVSELHGRRFATAHPHLNDPGIPIWQSNIAFLDSAGAWWFLTETKLFRFDRAPSLEALNTSRPSMVYETGARFHQGSFYRLFEDSHRNIWISSRSATPEGMGLSRWERATNTLHTFGPAEGFPDGRAPSAFCEDRATNLWIGFYHGGAARYTNGKFTLITSQDGLPEGFITSMYIDHFGRLWIGSGGGGLSRVDDPTAAHPTFINYSIANGLSSDNVRQITEDQDGRMYVGTVRGIDRLSPDTGQIKHYTAADALPDEFITVAFTAKDGTLWFGTQNGLSHLTPNRESAVHEPPISIGGLRIAGIKQPVAELGQSEIGPLNLKYTQGNVQIDFFSLTFASAERIRYQHLLEGADHNWSVPAAETTVSYANLAPGTYKFLVRAINSEGSISVTPAVISFRIAPPIWLRWWFVVSAMALFGVVIYWFTRMGLLRKLELERVRTRIATDLHDDIGASLTRIAMLSEVTRRQPDGLAPASANRLMQIADNARTVVDSMSDIVWAIDPLSDDFQSLVDRIRSFAADTLGAAGVRWELTVAPKLEERRLSPEQRRALYLIFKEAINNIARHANCRHASCRISLEHSLLVAEIEDDGCGLSADVNPNGRGGRGLTNMKSRATEIRADLEIRAMESGGTMVKVTLPLHSDNMNMFLRFRRKRLKIRVR